MSVIWKYPVSVGDVCHLTMPIGAQVLTVQLQHGEPHLWAVVQPDRPPELRSFRIVGTGHGFDNNGLNYVGTFQMAGGSLVWHLFEVVA